MAALSLALLSSSLVPAADAVQGAPTKPHHVVDTTHATRVAAPEPPDYKGGGVWVHPEKPDATWNFDQMPIEVKVTRPDLVDHVNFTATYGRYREWKVLCPNATADYRGVYEYDKNTGIAKCTWDPNGRGVDPLTGVITLSFDVYQKRRVINDDGSEYEIPPYNKAPNGVHRLTYGWGCLGVPPRQCGGW
jgi:hypothetical protein